jgi:hypothetical protein
MATTPTPLNPNANPDGNVSNPTPASPTGPQPQPQGLFGKIGAFLRQHSDDITDITNHLAAAAGNYAPMELAHQQRQDALQQQLQQSQLQNQALARQLTQQQINSYQTPDQQSARALALSRAEKPTTYQTDDGQTGIADTDLKGVSTPRMVNVPNPAIGLTQQRNADFNSAFPSGALPMTMPPLAPTVQRPAIMPQQVGFHVTGYDANGNPVVAEFGKGGVPMGNQPAPTPSNVAVPTSPWRTYLETGRKQGMNDADIVNRWNTTEAQRNNIKLVPQPDGTIQAVPVTEGSVTSRGSLGGSSATPQSSTPPVAPLNAPPAHAGAGRTVGGHAPKPVTDAFSTYNVSAERLNVMSDALPDALKGDQQAMLNLLSNHLGMTMGLQKGARMNQALIEEAMKSAPWLQGMQAKFDGRGYLSGVTLTPQQMQSMVKLAQDRANQDYQAYQRVQAETQKGFGMNASPNPPPAGPIMNPMLPKAPPRTANEYLQQLPQ